MVVALRTVDSRPRTHTASPEVQRGAERFGPGVSLGRQRSIDRSEVPFEWTGGERPPNLNVRGAKYVNRLASEARVSTDDSPESPRRTRRVPIDQRPTRKSPVTIDLTPTTERVAALLAAIPDDALHRPTPCPE